MTEQEREELIEQMAKAAAECGHDDWMHAENWFRDIYITRATAALAVAEPVIREQCAKIADATAKDYRVYRDHWPHAEGAEQVAAAIREGKHD